MYMYTTYTTNSMTRDTSITSLCTVPVCITRCTTNKNKNKYITERIENQQINKTKQSRCRQFRSKSLSRKHTSKIDRTRKTKVTFTFLSNFRGKDKEKKKKLLKFLNKLYKLDNHWIVSGYWHIITVNHLVH